MDDNFLAGIVLYNPDINRLKDNVKSIIDQVDKILMIDNGSLNIKEVSNIFSDYPNLEILCFNENKGIAKAHNTIMENAFLKGYNWVLLLDQDSVCPSDLISTYKRYVFDESIAMLTPKIIDRNFGELNYISQKQDNEYVNTCIASACALRVSAWKKVGGFCNEMFIDSVDFDMCFLLREHGFKILKINELKLIHEVGRSSVINIFGKDWMIFNHNPIRYYYMIRNSFLFASRHKNYIRQIKNIIRTFVFVNLFEHNRIQKNKYMFKGLFHGIIHKYGKYE